MKWVIHIVLFVFIFSTCNSGPEDKNDFYTIDFEQCLATERAMKLSEIADTIEYLELKTPEDIIITRIFDIIPVGDELIIHSRNGVFKFTKGGEFVKQIGRQGQGPGEYSMIFRIAVDFIKREIILADSGKVLFYDLDGNILRTEKFGTLYRIGVSDSILWVSEIADHTCKFIAFALNQEGDTVASISNLRFGMNSLDEGTGISTAKLLKAFYHYKGSLFLKGKEINDTIYQIAGKTSIPYAYLNMGKYKLPIEYEDWYSWDEFNKQGFHYWGVPAVVEDNHYLYLFALRFRSIDGNNYGDNIENYRYIIYDKENETGFVVKDKITDDILGGPPIWPHWITEDYYMNVVEWHELSDEIEEGRYTLAPILKKQLSKFGNDTNQLIVICHKKQKETK